MLERQAMHKRRLKLSGKERLMIMLMAVLFVAVVAYAFYVGARMATQ